MLLSNSIPDKVLENSNAQQFVNVLDALHIYKQEIIAEAARVNNPALYSDNKWLIKKFSDYGITDLPMEYPFQCLQQYLLNAGKIFSLKGSKLGLEMWLNVLTLGEVEIDDSDMYVGFSYIVLDDFDYGYIDDNNDDNNWLYLFSDTEELNPAGALEVTINSKFFNGDYPNEATIIKNYIEKAIRTNIGFSRNIDIEFTYGSADEFIYHEELNQYFI